MEWRNCAESIVSELQKCVLGGDINAFWKTIDRIERNGQTYTACTVDGISYVGTTKDDWIMPYMRVQKKNFAKEQIEIFHQLSKKYYAIEPGGYFLDLGANIGTTGIYFKRNIDPSVKILAFEPDPENYLMLRINYMLNRMEENVILENLGLGDVPCEKVLYQCPGNPGGNSVAYGDGTGERIHMVALDEYLEKSRITLEEIRYIWIDTEGFEPQVLMGAKKLLASGNIPLFMEFNPHCYRKFPGIYENMMEILAHCYKSYAFIPEAMRTKGDNYKHPINDLWKYQNVTHQIGDIFLIN